jgi:hypothetical protein
MHLSVAWLSRHLASDVGESLLSAATAVLPRKPFQGSWAPLAPLNPLPSAPRLRGSVAVRPIDGLMDGLISYNGMSDKSGGARGGRGSGRSSVQIACTCKLR